jgi:3-oxoacyl-[acyl-carrier-protein] synthase II
MNILGTGILFARGIGLAALEESLRSGWQKPDDVEVPRVAGLKLPVYQVNFDMVPEKRLLKQLRRADKLSKMAVLAAADALADSGMQNLDGKRIGIILATAFGPHGTTFNFLDDILDYGDAGVSPTTFSHSVHNAATSYIANSLNIQGPTVTVTQFRYSFQAALQLAKAWLDQGRCDRVLVGGIDHYGEVLGYVADHKLTTAPDGRIKPFTFNPTCQVPGEGAAFFLLGNETAGNSCCSVTARFDYEGEEAVTPADLDIIDADGMLPDESAYLSSLSAETPVTSYTPLFGSMMVGGALNLAAGVLMMKNQTVYAAPVQDNPYGLKVVTETGHARLDTIRCIGCNCYGEKTYTYLNRHLP